MRRWPFGTRFALAAVAIAIGVRVGVGLGVPRLAIGLTALILLALGYALSTTPRTTETSPAGTTDNAP